MSKIDDKSKEELEKLEQELQQEMMELQNKAIPNEQERDNQFKLMRDILALKDSKKTASLSHEELGLSKLTVRGCLKTALLCDALDIKDLGDIFREEAEITAATSMSKHVKGTNLLNLLFTQIQKRLTGTIPQEETKRKWYQFSKG
jgi:hypothetical protein